MVVTQYRQFFHPASKKLFKESCPYFRQTKFCFKKNLTQKMSPPPRFSYVQKVPEKQKIMFFGHTCNMSDRQNREYGINAAAMDED